MPSGQAMGVSGMDFHPEVLDTATWAAPCVYCAGRVVATVTWYRMPFEAPIRWRSWVTHCPEMDPRVDPFHAAQFVEVGKNVLHACVARGYYVHKGGL